ncbi:MAG: hypothetical protein LBK53_02170 [Heliobacteriaceae bacterium]|nr:hypothetical protein [Heliobacteriaceae bacterium]
MRATNGSAAIQSRLLIFRIASLLAAPRNDELTRQAQPSLPVCMLFSSLTSFFTY